MDFDLLNVIHPKINIQNDLKNLLDTAKKVTDWHDLLFLDESYERWAVFFMALIRHCDLQTSNEICEHLTIAPRHAKIFGEDRIQAEQQLTRLEWQKRMKNSDIFNILKAFKTEMILYMMVCTGSERSKKRISLYHTRLRNVTVTITGKDLLAMGLASGPVFSKTLQAVLEAKLNGQVKSRQDEFAFVRSKIPGLKHPPTKRLRS
jgi:tRNA nucleotidyltransferase (CCA-adding enzyme)